jgi:hypothetical protein
MSETQNGVGGVSFKLVVMIVAVHPLLDLSEWLSVR